MNICKNRSYTDSFIEGFIAPIMELTLSLILSYILWASDIISHVFEQLGQTLNASVNTSYSILDIVHLFPIVILIMGFLDLVRNFILAIVCPGHAVAHIIGETIILAIIYPIILLLSPETLYSCIISLMIMALGIITRFYIEYKLEKKEKHDIFY